MRKIQTSVVALVAVGLVALTAASGWAATIFEDDFESYDISGGPIDIVGQTSPSGQTYIAAPGALAGLPDPLNSMQVRDDLGIESAQGVGGTTGDGIRAATIDLGATYSTGIYTLGIDYRLSGNGEPQLFLGNAAGSSNLSVTVEKQAGMPGAEVGMALQGLGFGNHVIPGVVFNTPVDVRLITTVDLDTDMVTVSWEGLDEDNLGVSGTYSTAIPNPAYEFSFLHLYAGSRANPHGFDNIILVDGLLDPGLEGDLNTDGFVGQDDLNIILAEWGAMPPTDPRADPSGDGFVGQDDLNPVLADWGQGTPPGGVSAVPEPQSALLLGLGAMAVVAMFRTGRKRM